ncbi:hypothetical protein H4R24_001621 [Coemansia sp. RSA 988]|nr:hypothetical protein H4R24_001621 [Coemansia sp. RSA 988]
MTQPEQPGDTASTDSKDAQTSANKQLDQQLAVMQGMLKDLTAKVEIAERDVQDKVGGTDNADGFSQQQPQQMPYPQVPQDNEQSVSKALRDMSLVEKAVGDFEARLDQFLGGLDAMLDGHKQHVEAPPAEKGT